MPKLTGFAPGPIRGAARFQPERWERLAPSLHQYLPFGAGPRMCERREPERRNRRIIPPLAGARCGSGRGRYTEKAMHSIKVDEAAALVDITLSGRITASDSPLLCAELRRVFGSLRGRPIKILVDAQFLQPLAPAVADEFRSVQEYALTLGLQRVAQVVESSVVLLQRTRIMRESGTDPLTQTFRDRVAARKWLLSSDTRHEGTPSTRPPPQSTR
jgi:hypothetical protein